MSENKPTFIQAIKAAQLLKTKISPETAATIQQAKKHPSHKLPPTNPPQEPRAAVDNSLNTLNTARASAD